MAQGGAGWWSAGWWQTTWWQPAYWAEVNTGLPPVAPERWTATFHVQRTHAETFVAVRTFAETFER